GEGATLSCRPSADTVAEEGKEGSILLVDLIIGCFLGDDDIVDVAFAQSSTGDADETGALAQILDSAAAAVAHARTQSTDQLIHHIGDGAFVGDTSLDALRHELAGLRLVALEIAVAFATHHGAE